MRWQPVEAAEQVFVCLVFFLQTIIKAVRHHRFSCHDYLHANLTSSMRRQIISSLIPSKANCNYFLKKTLLFMRKLLSTNWVFHEFSPGSQTESCFYYLLPLYNQLFIGDDSFQPRKSNVGFFFFSSGKHDKEEAKNVELSLGLKKSSGFCCFLYKYTYMCTDICSHCVQAGSSDPPESNGPASVQSGEVKRYLRTWNGEIRTESYPRKCRSVGYIIIVAFIYLSHRWSSFSGLKWKWHVGKELHSIIQAFSLFWGIFPLIWGTYDNLVQPLAWVLLAGPLQQEHDVRSSVPSGWLSQSNFDFLKIESGISENCVQCSNRPRKPVLSFTVELELLVRDHG